MPGLVDTHIHACQYSYAGTALDMPLLQWLETYTFPVESHFKDLQFAHKVYSQVVVSYLALAMKMGTIAEHQSQGATTELCGTLQVRQV